MVYLGEDTQSIVCLFIASSAHIGYVTRHFRRKHGAERVPAIRDVIR